MIDRIFIPDFGWTDDPIAITNARSQPTIRKAQPKKRSGKTPEAKVSEACDALLEKLGFYVIRTSAGLTDFDGRKMQIGRKGQHDRTCCAPDGRFVSIELKSATGTPSDAQLDRCSRSTRPSCPPPTPSATWRSATCACRPTRAFRG